MESVGFGMPDASENTDRPLPFGSHPASFAGCVEFFLYGIYMRLSPGAEAACISFFSAYPIF